MEIPRGRGVAKAKVLKEKYGVKLEGWGRGMQTKKPSMGVVVWIYVLEPHNALRVSKICPTGIDSADTIHFSC